MKVKQVVLIMILSLGAITSQAQIRCKVWNDDGQMFQGWGPRILNARTEVFHQCVGELGNRNEEQCWNLTKPSKLRLSKMVSLGMGYVGKCEETL